MKLKMRPIAAVALLIALLTVALPISGLADGANAAASGAGARVVCNPCPRQPEIGNCCRYAASGIAPMAAEVALEDIILDGDTPLSAGLDANGDGEIDIDADIEHPVNGDIVTLSTPLSKVPNDFGLLCQWFVNRGDGRGFTPIEGANDKTYSYTYSDAFARHHFRVELSVPHTDGE